MEKHTVKRRIFISNALMILVTLACILVINLGVVKVYWETVEKDWKASMESMTNARDVGDMLEEWTVHRESFYMLVAADIAVCIAVWILVSLFFTGNLERHIRKPLNALERGAKRIQKNHLTEEINYRGDVEFEEICTAFNQMQAHILSEQEKNKRYEKARTEMIAGISHDLRTPLTAVRGTIKGLLDGVAKKPEQKEKFLRTAYKRTGDMNVLLDQLFYLSKLETGGIPLNLQQTDLAVFIRKYLAGKQELLQQEAIELTADTQAEEAVVNIDLEQLQRIFDNLLENSKKYAGVPQLKCRISLQETEQAFVVCAADNGQGVPEEKLEFIFDEFYRADESRNQKDGNGLGLYIVKSLTEAMGGKVSAENKDGLSIYLEFPKGA